MASRRQLFAVRALDVMAVITEFLQRVANSAIFTLFLLVVILMIDGTMSEFVKYQMNMQGIFSGLRQFYSQY